MSITEDQPVIKKQHSVAQKGAEELVLVPAADSILSNSPQQSDTDLSQLAFNKERQITKRDISRKNLNRFDCFSLRNKKKQKKEIKTLTWHGKHTICKAQKVQAQTVMEHKLPKFESQPAKRKMASKNVL